MKTSHKQKYLTKLSTKASRHRHRTTRSKMAFVMLIALMLAILPVSAFALHINSSNNSQQELSRRSSKLKTRTNQENTDTTSGSTDQQNPTVESSPIVTSPSTPDSSSPEQPNDTCTQHNTGYPKDMWVWQPSVAVNASERQELIAFAQSRNIQKIYLESEKLIRENQTALAEFIIAAEQACIKVDLLFGASDWSFTRNHTYAVSLAQKSVDFAQTAKVAPSGIHFDVEPYNSDEYKADPNSGGNQYLDMLEKISAVTKTSNLYFAKSIPLGFKFQTVNRNGVLVKMSEATIDRVDRVVLMAYRDTASRVIADSSEEISYASSAGKKITIGAETDCNTGEVETITYCEEGLAYMSAELAKIQTSLAGSSAYSGFAIHDYSAYRTLKP